MQKLDFDEALDALVARDNRYERDAYLFLRDALDFTVKEAHRGTPGTVATSRHVTGQELLDGVRRYALEQFGPMVTTVLGTWRVTTTDDFGRMVFNLIDANIFGRTDRDSLEDFRGGYTFHDAFVRPYLPPRRHHEPDPETAGCPEDGSPSPPVDGDLRAPLGAQ